MSSDGMVEIQTEIPDFVIDTLARLFYEQIIVYDTNDPAYASISFSSKN